MPTTQTIPIWELRKRQVIVFMRGGVQGALKNAIASSHSIWSLILEMETGEQGMRNEGVASLSCSSFLFAFRAIWVLTLIWFFVSGLNLHKLWILHSHSLKECRWSLFICWLYFHGSVPIILIDPGLAPSDPSEGLGLLSCFFRRVFETCRSSACPPPLPL